MSIKSGLTAGFSATVVLSLFMLAKHAVGVMPQLDPIAMILGMVGKMTGSTPVPIVGWVIHFFIGTVMWGILYSMVQAKLPGGPAIRGMAFAAGAWLVMMLVVMPMAGAGLFGLSLGMGAPVATLVLHLIFGATLGLVYARTSASA